MRGLKARSNATAPTRSSRHAVSAHPARYQDAAPAAASRRSGWACHDGAGGTREVSESSVAPCGLDATPTRIGPAWWFLPPTRSSTVQCVRPLAHRRRSSFASFPAVSPSKATRSTSSDATVVVVDLDAGRAEEMAALARLMARIGNWPPVIAVTQTFDENVARTLLQMRVADFLVKPVEPIDLVRACARVCQGCRRRCRTDRSEDLHLSARGRRCRRHDACRADAR